jgi:hypothetical protein
MLKLLANKILAFTQGEKDAKGQLIKEKTKIGFCTLPNWVENDDYYKMAVRDGSIKPFISSADDENVLKAQERLASLQDEIKALEEKKESLITAPVLAEKIDAKDVEKIESIGAELEARKEEVKGTKKSA